MALNKDFIVKEGIQVEGTASSISTTTGALIVNGGFGLGGNAWIGGKIVRGSDSTVLSSTQGAAFAINSATFTDAGLTATSTISIVNYIGSPKINSTNTGAIVGDAVNFYIDNAPSTASTKLSFTRKWALYINNGNTYLGSTSTNTSTFAGNALQVNGGISSKGLFVSGGGALEGTFYLNNAEIITSANQNSGNQDFTGQILFSTATNSYNKDSGAVIITNGGLGVEGNVYLGGILGANTGTFSSTLNSTSTTTGAVVISGGIGIGKDLYASNGFFVSGNYNTATVSGNSLQITNNGGLGVSGTSRFEKNVYISDTTDSNSVGSGALVISGGLGVAQKITAQTIDVVSTASATDSQTAAVTIAGGLGVGKNVIIGATSSSVSTTSSNALYVVGGVGIARDVLIGGNAVIQGNLTLLQEGTQLTVNSTQTYIADPVIDIGGGPNGDPLSIVDIFDKGLMIHYNNGTTSADNNHAFFGFEHTTGRFILKKNIYPGASNQYPINDLLNTGTYATFDLGTINLLDTTESDNTASGALIVAGGAAIQKQLNVGGSVFAASDVYISKGLTVTNSLRILSSVESTDINSGALIVDGGVGIKKSLNATTASFVKATITGGVTATSTTVGDLTVTGGVGADNVWTRVLTVDSPNNASNTNSGALQVVGGIGVGGNVYSDGTVRGQQIQVVSNLISSAGIVDITDDSQKIVDSFVGNAFSTVKYLVQITDVGSPKKFHVSEIVLTYDGSGTTDGVYISQYGILENTGELGTFQGIFDGGGNVRLVFTPNYMPVSMKIRAIRTALSAD